MRICIISSLQNAGYGSSTRPFYISKFLSDFGNEILHVCNQLPNFVNEISYDNKNKSENLKFIEKIYYKNDAIVFRFIKNFRYLINEIKKFEPDVIYPQMLVNGYLALWLNNFIKKPFVYDAHTSLYFEMTNIPDHEFNILREIVRLIERKVLKKSDMITTVSKETKEIFIEDYNVNSSKIKIVKNGTNTDVFKPEVKNLSILKELGIPNDERICVFTNPRIFGFKTNYYALYYLFEMIPLIEKRIGKIKFLILGGGPEPIPPSKNVIYTGFVEDLPAYINLADVCLAPFPPEAVCGGTRNKICEYLACGKPIVSTAEGMRGFDDAISGQHYLLGEDKEDFVDKLVFCLNNPNEIEKIGHNARALSNRYDWKLLIKEIDNHLKELN